MAKHWNVTSLVALALLGCLVWTKVEAQYSYQVPKGTTQQQQPLPPQQPPQPPPPQRPQQPQQHQQPLPPQQPQQPPPPQRPQQPQQPLPPQQPPPPPPQRPQQPQQLLPAQQPPPPQKPQKPQSPLRPQPHLQPQQSPFLPSCEVAAAQRIPCGGSGISADACKAISCCFDGQGCYFGKAVTVQVTKDAQFIVVVAKDVTQPSIDLESISLLGRGPHCTYVDSNSEFVIYQFPVTDCGTVVMEEHGVIIYQNKMSSSFEVGIGPFGAITRDTTFELLFQGRFTGTSIETVVVKVLQLQDPPLPVAALGPISVQLRLANGQCYTKGCNEVDVAYSSFYTTADYPVTKILRDPVYVEVQLLEKTDHFLVLTLGRCWATGGPNPYSLPQWEIITNGCPNKNDHYLSSLIPVVSSSGLDFPSHYRRFLFKMFTFVDPNSKQPLKEQVYIHCSTAVCQAIPGRNCEPSCANKRKRDVEAVDQMNAEPKIVASVGPINYHAHI
ncbi:zona pellucida sperm-binding protein 4-like [Sander vitreus]